jgi:hypothetical protein
MACELLVHRNSKNYSHSDAVKDKSGVYKKGYIVIGKTLPHSGWGNKEIFSAGNFVHIKVTDATWEELKDYAEHWRLFIDYELVGSNLEIDGHRFRIFSTNGGVSGYGNITRERIERYLNRWNAEIFSVASNEIVIDVTINNLLRSPAYWDYVPGDGLEDIGYSQLSYDQGTGEHVYLLDYSNVRPEILDRNSVAQRIAYRLSERGVTFANHDTENQTAEATIIRNDVLINFRNEVYKDVADNFPLYRRKFYIEESDVDSLVQYSENNNGEPYEVTKAQLANYFKDMENKVDA